MRDWTLPIATLFGLRSDISDEDPLGLWPYHLPRVPATADDLEKAEQVLGVQLDEKHKHFLRFVNGWPAFF